MHTHTHTHTNVVGLRVHDRGGGGGTHLRGLHNNNINIVCAAATIRFVQALDGGGESRWSPHVGRSS